MSFLLVILLALGASAPAHARVMTASRPRQLRVLFIGNSYTHFHALPLVVRRLVESVEPSTRVRVESITHPGWDLARHWTLGRARRRIERGHFTHVVLQGHSLAAIREPEALRTSVADFQRVIEASGARTVLYETWARTEGADVYTEGEASGRVEMQQQIDRAYAELTERGHAIVAPVGPVFLHVESLLPEARLIEEDHSHPTELGTYVAGCVIANALTSVDVRELAYRPRRFSRGSAASLRQAVAEALAAR